MIGLNSSVTSSVVDSKYSASFDGTDDYIDTNNTFSSTFTDSFSISVWVKVDDGNPAATKYICGSSNSTSQDEVFIKISTAGLLAFVVKSDNDTGLRETDAAVFTDGANDWKHIVCTATKSGSGNTLLTIYVNGSVVASNPDSELTEANHTNFSTDIHFAIGALNNNGTRQGNFDGGIDEFAIFNTVLDSDAVSAIYNGGSPLNLTFDQSNYDNSSALKAYYRMGNGLFDDKTNGVVHDQDNPGFGSEIVTGNNSTFDGSNDWAIYNPGGDTAINTTGGVLVVTLRNDAGSGAQLELSSSLTAGKTYKIEADIWLGTSTETDHWRIYLGGVNESITLSSNKTRFTTYITTTDTTDLVIYNTNAGSSTGTFNIDNVSVLEISGNPSVTSGGVTFSSDTP